ncbi:MAG TPA: ADP-polyphosphate phosphotransferase [Bryobacteraceae bacterium]|nr:ADP-polyphosphate phosphotransferase [Bryobacteraceae bacterium]
MKKINPDDFRAKPGKKIDLDKWPTKGKPAYGSNDEYKQILRDHIEKLAELQNLLYATNRYALLLIFQAMDAAGKDSAIKHVMSGVNPQGCQVFSFKHPSNEELEHDFLWSAERRLPERGHIGIFNRSYYEEVLIVRVHQEILAAEELPKELAERKHIWRDRYRSIRHLEDHLHLNGTRVVKFFLHLSKDEQKKRFLKRIDDPDKNWKFSADDIKERSYWDQYMKAFEECISATSTKTAPWYIVPADDKANTGLIISRVILDALEDLKMSYPETTPERKRELQAIRKKLTKGN